MTFWTPEHAATLEPEGWSDEAKYLCLTVDGLTLVRKRDDPCAEGAGAA